jgi:hypothetical protein
MAGKFGCIEAIGASPTPGRNLHPGVEEHKFKWLIPHNQFKKITKRAHVQTSPTHFTEQNSL